MLTKKQTFKSNFGGAFGFIRKNISIKALLLSIVYIVLSAIGHWKLVIDKTAFFEAPPLFLLLQLIFKAFAVLFILFFGQAVQYSFKHRRNEKIRRFLKYFGIYFAAMLGFLLLTYPGAWCWDEFSLLEGARKGFISTWQHVLTQVFYSISLNIIPFNVGVLIIQLFIVSLIVGYVMLKLSCHIKPRLVYLFYIPMLLPPIIYFNLLPMRMTLYSFLELFLFVSVFFAYIEKKKLTYPTVVSWGILSTILCLWRSEGIIFYVLFPLLLVILFFKQIKIKQIALIAAIMLVISLPVNYLQNIEQITSDRYFITGIMQPLYSILKSGFNSDTPEEDIKIIDNVIDVEKFISAPTAEIAFWTTEKWDFTEDEFALFRKTVIKLFLNNKETLMKDRFEVFLDGSGLRGNARISSSDYSESDFRWNTSGLQGFWNAPLSKPINADLRRAVLNILRCSPLDTSTDLIREDANAFSVYAIFYNLFAVLALCIIAVIILLFGKMRRCVFFYLALLAQAAVTFATSPSPYFMYYQPLFTNALAFTVIAVLLYAANFKNKKDEPLGL